MTLMENDLTENDAVARNWALSSQGGARVSRMRTRTFRAPASVDLVLTLGPLRHGRADPTIRLAPDEALRAARTPAGPATLHLKVRKGSITARAWGSGAGWALDQAPQLVGVHDDRDAFSTDHPVVHRLHRTTPGLRLCASGLVMDTLVPTILEQKITSREAHRSFAALVRLYGEPAPGPGGLLLQPHAERLASLPYWSFHPLGVARARADTIRRACAGAARLEEAAHLPPAEGARRLRSVTGIGPWTVGLVLGTCRGDPDTVVVGDFHLPHAVTWALAREPRGSDHRMLELLARFAGQRGRVVRLIAAAGVRPPQTTHRRRIHRIAAH